MWYDDDEETADPPRWYAVGIVSFGLAQCAQANFAGVYTRCALISLYSHSIAQRVIENESLFD